MAQTDAKSVGGRTLLIQRAAELFAENGFHGTGLADLERATGLGRGSIYHYVSGKDDLLYRITTEYLMRLIDAGDDIINQDTDPAAKLKQFSERVMHEIVEHLAEITVCFRDLHAVPAHRKDEVLDLHRRYEEVWARILEEGVAAGSFEVNTPLVVKAIVGLHHYTYLWVNPGGKLRAADLAERFSDFVLNGISSRK